MNHQSLNDDCLEDGELHLLDFDGSAGRLRAAGHGGMKRALIEKRQGRRLSGTGGLLRIADVYPSASLCKAGCPINIERR
jgi:hypothetical protein